MFLFVLILLVVSILEMVCVLNGGREQIEKSHLCVFILSLALVYLTNGLIHASSTLLPHCKKKRAKAVHFLRTFAFNKSHVEDANDLFLRCGLASVWWNMTLPSSSSSN